MYCFCARFDDGWWPVGRKVAQQAELDDLAAPGAAVRHDWQITTHLQTDDTNIHTHAIVTPIDPIYPA